MSKRLVLMGAGHMGSAIARGLLRSGNRNIYIVDPDQSKLEAFSAQGVPVSTECKTLFPDDMLVLAMPPQAFPSFAQAFAQAHHGAGLVVSAMAGVRIESIQSALRTSLVIRTIPNTPSEVFEGMTLYCKSPAVDDVQMAAARQLFNAIGHSAELLDESLIDAGTALCGGGPAFLSYFADALQRFGVQAGIGEVACRKTVIQLLRGTAQLLEITGKPALQVAEEVMTPGGTTERGIWHFDRAQLTQIVIDALSQSALRSRELGMEATAAFPQGVRCLA